MCPGDSESVSSSKTSKGTKRCNKYWNVLHWHTWKETEILIDLFDFVCVCIEWCMSSMLLNTDQWIRKDFNWCKNLFSLCLFGWFVYHVHVAHGVKLLWMLPLLIKCQLFKSNLCFLCCHHSQLIVIALVYVTSRFGYSGLFFFFFNTSCIYIYIWRIFGSHEKWVYAMNSVRPVDCPDVTKTLTLQFSWTL